MRGQRSEVRGQGAVASIAEQLTAARAQLAPIAREQAGLEARLLAARAWGMTPEALVLLGHETREAAPLAALVARRLTAEPVAQILGTRDFWKAQFEVSRDVLTPRPDSETLIETLLRLRPDRHASYRMLDLGTGSGCLLLSALAEYSNAHGVGVDQSNAALAIATRNAAAQQLSSRVQYVRSNWCSNVSGKFDIVLANPPYIPTAEIATLDADVRTFEPHAALDGGADGLDAYRSILHTLMPHVAAGSLLLFEVGMGQAEDVAALGARAGWQLQEIVHDLAGIARVVALTFPASRNNDIKE